MPDPFIPPEQAWVRSHYFDVPNETVAFCDSLSGANVLNVGCGEMLTDFGLLNCGVTHITGLDLDQKPSGHLDAVAEKLRRHDIQPPADFPTRISYQPYDGTHFPFEDRQFDFVFSWSAFEHIADVYRVLVEIRRVLSDEGRAFIQVYPWYHCFAGSHLQDFIPDPYVHLTRDADWVREKLHQYDQQHGNTQTDFLNYMFSEYQTLNRYSANRFYQDVSRAGFKVVKARLISYDLDLSQAPPGLDFSSLMICGTKMLLKKDSSGPHPHVPSSDNSVDDLLRIARDRESQILALRRSLSWRLTAPLRAIGGMFLGKPRPK